MISPQIDQSSNQFVATVGENIFLCRDHYRLVLRVPRFPATKPGQFIQIACRNMDSGEGELPEFEWNPEAPTVPRGSEFCEASATLRRPFSLAGRRDFSTHIELDIIHRVVGLGTHWLAKLKIGDAVGILGPLGNAFKLPAANSTALLIGGGVGIPPMIYLASALRGYKAVAFAGALTLDLLPLTITEAIPDGEPRKSIGEFAEYNIPAVIATDDGSLGYRGFVTQALENYLDTHKPTNPTLYTCGPEPMMKRVADIAARRGFACQIAVERAMACGMGTCQSCCIRVRKPDPSQPPLPGKDWCYRLSCTDGPIFQAADLLW
jgi:dihydroorotate dehydrogenase electron transfer subunit